MIDMMGFVLGLAAGVVAITLLWIGIRRLIEARQGPQEPAPVPHPPPVVEMDLQPIYKAIEGIPGKVLQSITGSANTHKGALGELIGYVNMRAQYDKIIPLGNVADFICIKYPDESGEGGHLDFVDVKNGPGARLSKDQRALKKLIENKQIEFIKLKVSQE